MNTTSATAASAENSARLKNFPIAWFAVIMGLAGLTIAWARTERTFVLEASVSPWLLGVSIAVFVILALIYSAKALRYREAVTAELVHPVKQAFVPTFSIGLILLSIATYATAPGISLWLWSAGTLLHLILTLYVLSSWIHHSKYEIGHLNPAWFIPVVGNIIVPIAAVPHGAWEVAWLFFAVGLVFWLVLLTLVFYRLIFHPPLPDKLVPTLAILVAPPAAGFLAYVALNGGRLDGFARVLYGAGLFLLLLLAAQLGRLARLKFYLSWWAYSFPLAALTLATLRMTQLTGQPAYRYLGYVLLALLSAVLALLAVRTLLAVARREVCVEEA